jgi:hypothetical protein
MKEKGKRKKETGRMHEGDGMTSSSQRWIPGIAGLVLALILGLGAPSVAVAGGGSGLVVAKDLATNHLTLHTGVVLEVGDHTRLLSARGKRITLDDIELAPTILGIVQRYGPAMVSYEGRERDAIVQVTMVRVQGTVPQ